MNDHIIIIDDQLQPYDIENIYVVIAIDADGREGIITQTIPGVGSLPLLTTDTNLSPALAQQASRLAADVAKHGKTLELRRYGSMEVLEKF